jgi:hypothetical protein
MTTLSQKHKTLIMPVSRLLWVTPRTTQVIVVTFTKQSAWLAALKMEGWLERTPSE